MATFISQICFILYSISICQRGILQQHNHSHAHPIHLYNKPSVATPYLRPTKENMTSCPTTNLRTTHRLPSTHDALTHANNPDPTPKPRNKPPNLQKKPYATADPPKPPNPRKNKHASTANNTNKMC
mmetsp:Transcript_292/g.530  ORF Transcript_292/g.530 Transcript_292/m.530 type:complete len:127 (-) Transcript_292:234-614(-)